MLTPSISTETLFERAIAGDQEAQQGILTRGYTSITKAARCRLGQESQDALDVACDAWLRFQSRWSGWRGTGPFESYAAGFVYHTLLDLYRRRARLVLREPPRVDLVYFDAEQDTDDRRLLERIARGIEQLPGRQREAFSRFLEGQNPGQIAAGMGITAATVRVHISHARRTLVRQLFPAEAGRQDEVRDSAPGYCLV